MADITLAAPPIILVYTMPLKTCTSPLEPQSVHHKIKPAVGEIIASLCADVILGGKNPWVVEVTSNTADTSGDAVPMLTLVPLSII